MFQTLCVFCGGSTRGDPSYLEIAKAVGQLLAKSNITLIYGGGNIGLMGAVASGAMDNGGKVIGIIPEHLQDTEKGHTGITELHVVKDMHERKKRMFDLSDGFITLPGGFGTLDEIFEILTWKQLALHTKPIVFLNHRGYWDKLHGMMEFMVEEKFIRDQHMEFFEVCSGVEDIFESLEISLHRKPLQFVGHTDIEIHPKKS